jgi:hypothetical protein
MISHRHRCIFVHVPKTGGKSVLAAFGLPEFGRDYTRRLPHIGRPFGHHPVAVYRDGTAGYFSFAFVRNPWDRLVSAFFYLHAGGANAEDADFRDRHLSRFAGRFDRFLDGLPDLIDHQHFRPQTHWLRAPDGRIDLDFIGRFERFADDLTAVAERLDLGMATVAHRNRSSHEGYRAYYDSRGIDLVASLYAADIETFGYQFDDPLT